MSKILKYIPIKGLYLNVGTCRGYGTAVISKYKPKVGLDYGSRSLRIAKRKYNLLVQGPVKTIKRLIKVSCFEPVYKKYVWYWASNLILKRFCVSDLFILRK